MTLSQKLLDNINSLYVSQNTEREIILTEKIRITQLQSVLAEIVMLY